MELLVLLLTGFAVVCFLLLIEVVVFGLNNLTEKCESLKKQLHEKKEKKND